MQNYKNLPLYPVNVKFFLQLGLIGRFTRAKQILLAFVPVATYLGQIINLYKTWGGDIGETGMNLYMLAHITHCLVRFFMVVRNNERFVRFLQCIDRWYKNIELNSDVEAVALFRLMLCMLLFFLSLSLKVDTLWYEGNLELCKCVQIMIARSHKPL
ncbi:uncharacterized protein LOC126752388 [Bactrocera neohumeralis]|uniref:uncharacterized protein LOC126752388 n=1 Tax=Bactrocera neohumeralis TaxID=98809 RepID=UPI0021666DCB|nr:uncharacterized protein LOC126752388 [Bactrocera neohumeralis]